MYFLFRSDPLCIEDEKCNGENGITDDAEDPLSTTETNQKKKRKSSAEKFLEDNSEYYGFQVLPSKLRSSSVDSSTTTTTSFPNPFLDFLHRSNTATVTGGDNDNGAGNSSEQTQKLQHVRVNFERKYCTSRTTNGSIF